MGDRDIAHPSEHKRKRSADDTWGVPLKRAAPDPSPRASKEEAPAATPNARRASSSSGSRPLERRDLWHAQISKLYASYNLLLRKSDTDPPGNNELQEFQRIIAVASVEGGEAEQEDEMALAV
jgi:hypothetical protein